MKPNSRERSGNRREAGRLGAVTIVTNMAGRGMVPILFWVAIPGFEA